MGSASLTGVICINCKTRYPAGVTDQPCPKCGSVRRTFLQATTAEIKPQGMVEWLRTDKQDRVLGYGDTGRHGAVRHGNLELDNTIALMIEGRAPRNEEDTDRDVDGRSESALSELDVQVVKTLSEMQFWRKLALAVRLSQRLTLMQATDFLKRAIVQKSDKLSVRQRATRPRARCRPPAGARAPD
jgi:hypothetical protein